MTRNIHIRLPGTELEVSRICLGGNRFGATLDQDASFALLDDFFDAGGNFIDTAKVYADWMPDIERSTSEKTIGRWLASRGLLDRVTVATKGGHPILDDPEHRRLDSASLREDAERSRDNLGVQAVAIFYLHRDDPNRPVTEILASLEDMRRDGLIRHYAASNWSAARLAAASRAATQHGWQGFIANQPEWSLATRNPGSAAADLIAMDRDMFAWHQEHSIVAIPYSSQARGYFDKVASGRLDEGTAEAYDDDRNRALADRLTEVATNTGATPTQIMLALMMKAPFPVIPVVGCHSKQQILSTFKSLDLSLDSPLPLTEMLDFQVCRKKGSGSL